MSEDTNAWSRVTCDFTDSEFCEWVRERCEMTLKNTAAGVYMQGLIDRLLKSEAHINAADARIAELEAERDEMREALLYIRDSPWFASNVQAVARQALWHKEGGG